MISSEVVVLRELERVIIYITKISKQVTKSHVRDTVYIYPYKLRRYTNNNNSYLDT
jgi:hypothetical protein